MPFIEYSRRMFFTHTFHWCKLNISMHNSKLKLIFDNKEKKINTLKIRNIATDIFFRMSNTRKYITNRWKYHMWESKGVYQNADFIEEERNRWAIIKRIKCKCPLSLTSCWKKIFSYLLQALQNCLLCFFNKFDFSDKI
jgi:hypothetical protein